MNSPETDPPTGLVRALSALSLTRLSGSLLVYQAYRGYLWPT